MDAGLRWSVDSDGIRTVISSLGPKMRACYQTWLAGRRDDDQLSGILVVASTIGSTESEEAGEVSDFRILRDDVEDVFLSRWLMHVLATLSFDPHEKPIKVRYPFMLSRQ